MAPYRLSLSSYKFGGDGRDRSLGDGELAIGNHVLLVFLGSASTHDEGTLALFLVLDLGRQPLHPLLAKDLIFPLLPQVDGVNFSIQLILS